MRTHLHIGLPWCASAIFAVARLPCDLRLHWRRTLTCPATCRTCPATRSFSSCLLCRLALGALCHCTAVSPSIWLGREKPKQVWHNTSLVQHQYDTSPSRVQLSNASPSRVRPQSIIRPGSLHCVSKILGMQSVPLEPATCRSVVLILVQVISLTVDAVQAARPAQRPSSEGATVTAKPQFHGLK